MTRVGIAALALLAGSLSLLACGGPAPTIQVDADATVISTSLDFNVKQFTLPADVVTKIHHVNRSLNPHNIAIYSDSAATTLLYRGEAIESRDIVYDVPALPSGTYFFRCDLHPIEMTGTVTVQADGG